jgi:hypothetical protein
VARNSKALFILLAVVAAMFAAAMAELFVLRFESGDVYEPYSSLRSDPVGVRAFYEGLASMRGIVVRRNEEPLYNLGRGRDTTLFLCGANLSKDSRRVIDALETFVADGGRLVLTFYPVPEEPPYWAHEKEKDKKKQDRDKDESKDADKEESAEPQEQGPKSQTDQPKEHTDQKQEKNADQEQEEGLPPWAQMISIEERWGFSYAFARLPGSTDETTGIAHAEKQAGPDSFPEKVSWHSALYFDTIAEAWRPLYAWDQHVVLMERDWGRGTMVLCSDSYLLSNEAMSRERRPDLLAWLVGPSSRIVFDEAHLGIQASPGVMGLARRYRLDTLLIAMILVAGLFVWKNAASLVPKREAVEVEALPAQPRDATAGLVNLLRRSIPSGRILPVCVEEWLRSSLQDPEEMQDKRARIRAILDHEAARPAGQRDPVAAYRAICAVVESEGPRTWRTTRKESET